MGLTYTINSSTRQDISDHLLNCNEEFIPRLDSQVNIEEYSVKLLKRATRFEAWDNKILVGLVATYYNDESTHTGFVTSVSVLRSHSRKGIASRLLEMSSNFGLANSFIKVVLKVSQQNLIGISLYRKLQFKVISQEGSFLLMELDLRSRSNPTD